MADYKTADTASLERKRQKLMVERAAIHHEQREVAAELDRRYSEYALETDLAELERKHNIQLVRPDGIESAEAVNGQ